MARTEDIEAKLAAYIDGELDAAQRAEIEKHLSEHPKHRVLIQELMGQKDLLKALPKQAAPADLAEAFTAQLERAVLLGDVDAQETHPPMRIGFFQQFRAVAAVLLLTCGLAAVIYQLLPRPHGSDSPLADLRMAPVTPGLGVALELDPRSETTIIPPAISLAPTPAPAEARVDNDIFSGPATAPASVEQPPIALADAAAARDLSKEAMTPLTARETGPRPMFSNVGTGSDIVFREMVQEQQLRLAAGAPKRDETVVLRAENMDLANLEVTRYLDTNNIKWETQTEPLPAPLRQNEAQSTAASRLQMADVAVKSGLPGAGRGGAGNEASMQQSAGGNQRIVAKQVSRQQAQQVVSDMNLLQTRLAVSNTRASADAPQSNALDLSQGSVPWASKSEDLSSVARGGRGDPVAGASVSPATLPSSALRLLPVDPTALYYLYREPLSISVPTTQPNAGAAVAGAGGDAVDVVIVIEPNAAVSPVAPATQPAGGNPQ